MLRCLENQSGVGPAPSPVIFTTSADVSVRGDLNDGLDSPSSVSGAPVGAIENSPGQGTLKACRRPGITRLHQQAL